MNAWMIIQKYAIFKNLFKTKPQQYMKSTYCKLLLRSLATHHVLDEINMAWLKGNFNFSREEKSMAIA